MLFPLIHGAGLIQPLAIYVNLDVSHVFNLALQITSRVIRIKINNLFTAANPCNFEALDKMLGMIGIFALSSFTAGGSSKCLHFCLRQVANKMQVILGTVLLRIIAWQYRHCLQNYSTDTPTLHIISF